MGWIALVLAVFLFYRWVERPHKIVFFKAIGAIVGVVAVTGGSYWGYTALNESRSGSGTDGNWPPVSVVFSSQSLKTEATTQDKLVSAAWIKFLGERKWVSEGLSAAEQELLKTGFGFYRFSSNKLWDKIQGDMKEEVAIVLAALNTDENFDSDSPEFQRKIQPLERQRADRYLTELKERRREPSTSSAKVLDGLVLYRRWGFLSGEAARYYRDHLNSAEVKLLEQAKGLVEEFNEQVDEEFNKSGLRSSVTFKICNKRSQELNAVTFNAFGLQRGRSTHHSLEAGGYRSESEFKNDIIIKPKQCSSITWTGKYHFFDKIETDQIYPTFAIK